MLLLCAVFNITLLDTPIECYGHAKLLAHEAKGRYDILSQT